jgi:hypothetical protein
MKHLQLIEPRLQILQVMTLELYMVMFRSLRITIYSSNVTGMFYCKTY